MKPITLLLALLLGFALQTHAQAPVGNPALPARLELSYADMKHMARMDGQNLDPGAEMKLVQEFTHGKHVVEILAVKGLFKLEPAGETILDLPGGYLTRARLKAGVLQVIDTIPLPGAAPVAAPVPVAEPVIQQVTTTTVTTTTAAPAAPAQTVTLGMGVPGMQGLGVTMNVSGLETGSSVQTQETVTTVTSTPVAAPVPVAAPRASKILFLSEEGMCTVYIDGKKRTELPMSGIDEMASATVFDIMPGRYQLKVEGFDVWYEGILTVGSGEQIKLRVEPQSLTEIDRSPLP